MDNKLEQILTNRLITTLFQPLISVKRRDVFAVEALSRGIGEDGETVLPAASLFSLPTTHSELLALDRLCRELALENFAPIHKQNPSLLVSLNIDAAIIDASVAKSTHLYDVARKTGIPPENIIIEIIESKAADMAQLMGFVDHYRQCGFLIALDDVGTGHSNLDRLPYLLPDIIKIDRSLISDVDNLFHKRAIVMALQQLASKVGTMVLAEGVEEKAEAIACMEMGIEFFQGFLFARPQIPAKSDFNEIRFKVNSLAQDFKAHIMDRFSRKRRRAEYHRSIARLLSSEISVLDYSEYDDRVNNFMNRFPTVECVYVLDSDGIQISDTFFNGAASLATGKQLYKPAQIHTDHSLKEYYLPLKAGLRSYTTDPYISMATGRRCTTIAAYFRDRSGAKNILCIDLDCDVSMMDEGQALPHPE